MRHLATCMHTSIGTTSTCQRHRLPEHMPQNGFHLALDGPQVTLMGPAVEVGTVIGNVQAQTDQPATSGSGLI